MAGPLLVLGLPPSAGAGLLPEHDSAPLTELPATRVAPLLPVMLAGPPMVFPEHGHPAAVTGDVGRSANDRPAQRRR